MSCNLKHQYGVYIWPLHDHLVQDEPDSQSQHPWGGGGSAVEQQGTYSQTPGRIQKVDPLMGVPMKYP